MYHLAQINIGRILAPLDDPVMEGFVSRLADVNALADASPGFLWRLQTAEGDATAVRPYEDTSILINMSVWESLEALTAFVYASAHKPVMAQRRAWFASFEGPYMALWWVPAGHIPSVAEAVERLERLRAHGPTSMAFTFKVPFPAPDGSVAPPAQLVECA